MPTQDFTNANDYNLANILYINRIPPVPDGQRATFHAAIPGYFYVGGIRNGQSRDHIAGQDPKQHATERCFGVLENKAYDI